MEDNLTYRYELKFVLSQNDLSSLYTFINQHASLFKVSFPERTVNNIYFDNINFDCCFQNLDGISQRTKIRYRWYGNHENFGSGQLELKIKNNALGTKKYFDLMHTNGIDDLEREVQKIFYKQSLQASLHNQYSRKYYVDYSRKYRITIDQNLAYWLPNQFSNVPSYSDNRIIVELKFNEEDSNGADFITSKFPFRLSKHSKYGSGLLNLVY